MPLKFVRSDSVGCKKTLSENLLSLELLLTNATHLKCQQKLKEGIASQDDFGWRAKVAPYEDPAFS